MKELIDLCKRLADVIKSSSSPANKPSEQASDIETGRGTNERRTIQNKRT